jgi:hypothetical protein
MKPWPNKESVDLSSRFPTLAAETKTRRGSTPRTKTCPRGPRGWGTPLSAELRDVDLGSCVPTLAAETKTRRVSTPRTKTCPRGPRMWGTQGFCGDQGGAQ